VCVRVCACVCVCVAFAFKIYFCLAPFLWLLFVAKDFKIVVMKGGGREALLPWLLLLFNLSKERQRISKLHKHMCNSLPLSLSLTFTVSGFSMIRTLALIKMANVCLSVCYSVCMCVLYSIYYCHSLWHLPTFSLPVFAFVWICARTESY